MAEPAMSIGQHILDRLTSTSIFRIERAGEDHIIVWSSGAAEQLEAMALEAVAKQKAPETLTPAPLPEGESKKPSRHWGLWS